MTMQFLQSEAQLTTQALEFGHDLGGNGGG
jgi:hypothetical protein